MEVNSGLVDTAALRLHRRIKLASKKYFPPSFYFQRYPGNLFFLAIVYASVIIYICTPFLLFIYSSHMTQLLNPNREAWKIMTFFSCYCYYKTLFHVVLLRWHREMCLIVMNIECVSKSCLAPQASFSSQWTVTQVWKSWSVIVADLHKSTVYPVAFHHPWHGWLSRDLDSAVTLTSFTKVTTHFCPLKTWVGDQGQWEWFLPTFLFSCYVY